MKANNELYGVTGEANGDPGSQKPTTKAKVNKEAFREALSRISKIMKKSDLIYSKMILLEVKDKTLYLSGVQNAISMQTKIENVEMDEPFTCLFEGNMVMALLSKMSAGDSILEYDSEKSNLYLFDESSKVKVKIRCEDPKKFAGWRAMDDPDFEKETDVLFPNISNCKHALPTRDTDAIMSSFCIQYGEDEWKITAIDGSRVSSRGDMKQVENTILVPGDTMTLLESIFMDKKIVLSMKGEDLWIRDEQTSVFLRTVAGTYYNIDKIINASHKYQVRLNREEFLNALTLGNVALLNETIKKGVFVFDGKENRVEIWTRDNLGNELNSDITFVDSNLDKTFKIGLNMKFILEAVKTVPDDVITIELSSEVTPIKISGEGYTEIVLPIKLRA